MGILFRFPLGSKLLSALRILRNDGPTELIFMAIWEYEKHVYSSDSAWKSVIAVPLILLYQLHLLFDEGALAYPIGRQKWQLIQLPQFRRGRQTPTLDVTARYRHGSRKHQQIMAQLYSCPRFASIEPEDTVVDVGAYIGGFSMVAAKQAKKVIAIEPNAATDRILQYNMADFDNVEIVPKAAWNTEETVEINQSYHPNENSILSVDRRDTQKSYGVPADTVPNIVRQLGHDSIEFLKIEAEGVELEILEGALKDEMEIRKIAVDASAERDGEDSVEEIVSLLESYGYRCQIKDEEIRWGEYIVFAVQNQ